MGCTSSKQFLREERRRGKQAKPSIETNVSPTSSNDSEAKDSPPPTTMRDTKTPETNSKPVVTNSIFGPDGLYGEGSSRTHDNHGQDDGIGSNTEGESGTLVERVDGRSSSNYDAGADVGGGPDCGERTSVSGEQHRYLMSDPFLELIKDDGGLPDVQAERMETTEELKGRPEAVPEVPDATTNIADDRLCACFAREGSTHGYPSEDHGAV